MTKVGRRLGVLLGVAPASAPYSPSSQSVTTPVAECMPMVLGYPVVPRQPSRSCPPSRCRKSGGPSSTGVQSPWSPRLTGCHQRCAVRGCRKWSG
eukprot:scaffold245477_cov32-Prasinocladus_malaysianus.AAC.1